jgi:hypothetical protein
MSNVAESVLLRTGGDETPDSLYRQGGNDMLWYCAFTWYPNTTRKQVAQRILQQHEAGAHSSEEIKGWYNLAGGGSGFLLVEKNSPQELTAMLQPYMDLMSWDVRAIYALDYNQRLQELRQTVAQGTS